MRNYRAMNPDKLQQCLHELETQSDEPRTPSIWSAAPRPFTAADRPPLSRDRPLGACPRRSVNPVTLGDDHIAIDACDRQAAISRRSWRPHRRCDPVWRRRSSSEDTHMMGADLRKRVMPGRPSAVITLALRCARSRASFITSMCQRKPLALRVAAHALRDASPRPFAAVGVLPCPVRIAQRL